ITVTQSLGFLTDNKTVKIHSVKVMAPYTVTANGKDKVIIQAQITDKHNNPVSKGVTVGWISDLGKLAAPLSMTNKQGIAEITLSSTQAGKAKVTAVLNNQQSVNADHIVTFTEGDISASLSTVAIFPDTIVAGANKATVTITLKDKEGNLLPNLANKITLTPQTNLQTTITPFKEKQKGIYQAQVSALKTGKTSLSAHVAPLAIKQSVSLTVLPNNTTAKVKNFTISNMQPHAGESITYKAYLVDNHDNPVGIGVPVAWSTNEGSQLETPLT
ncbi:Ig-like domain-containing protein, partial [Escherichia coli]|nr:Ig-like domain-containing protein [Escherichia coli]